MLRKFKKWLWHFKFVRKSIRAVKYRFTEKPKLVCRDCGFDRFAKFSSFNYKACLDCGHKIEWKLKENQKILVRFKQDANY
jgi:DNA-directed RNA polymerase subunit RPC12/RpoP